MGDLIAVLDRIRIAGLGRRGRLACHAIREVPGNPASLAVRAIIAGLPGVGDRLADDAVQNTRLMGTAKLVEPLADSLE